MADKKEVEAKEEKQIKAEIEGEKLKEQLLKMSEIALWLDTYDDIFSDFDPRPFSQRAMSVDFLDEIKRASRDKVSGQIELRFMIPKDLRKENEELQIKKRLKDHFKKHAEELGKETKKTTITGFSIAGLGFLFMFVGIFFHYMLGERVMTDVLVTLFEPLGWFMMFYGFDTVFYTTRQKHPEVEFYQKMSKAEISFVSY